jgi:hypothetical protein
MSSIPTKFRFGAALGLASGKMDGRIVGLDAKELGRTEDTNVGIV